MKENHVKAAFILFITAVITCSAFYFSLLDIWQEKIFDAFFTKKSAPNTIVIFAIDNESIAKVGQWPWQRGVFADAINKLQSAKIIGIDVNFSEPSAINPQGDFLFARAMENSKPGVILPVQTRVATKEKTQPLEIFKDHSLSGSVDIIYTDSSARTVQNIQEDGESFGAVAALAQNPDLAMPTVMRIDYAGPQNTFLTLPIIDLLENKVPDHIYKNAIVLIGATAPDLHDYLQTPLGLLPGVEIHANIINTILGQRFYRPFPLWASLLAILFCNALAALVIINAKKIFWLVSGLAGIAALINIMAMVLFSQKIVFPVLYVNLGFLATSRG